MQCTMHELRSTMLSSAGYDPLKRLLYVTFRKQQATYCYANVPVALWEQLQRARSVGMWMRSHIIGRFPSAKVLAGQTDTLFLDSLRYSTAAYNAVDATLTLELRGDGMRCVYEQVDRATYDGFLLAPSRELFATTVLQQLAHHSYPPYSVQLRPVQSQLCTACGYDAASKKLFVRMHSGALYQYPLEERVWTAMERSPALGAQLRAFVLLDRTGVLVTAI